jgi:hypothetical protein
MSATLPTATGYKHPGAKIKKKKMYDTTKWWKCKLLLMCGSSLHLTDLYLFVTTAPSRTSKVLPKSASHSLTVCFKDFRSHHQLPLTCPFWVGEHICSYDFLYYS